MNEEQANALAQKAQQRMDAYCTSQGWSLMGFDAVYAEPFQEESGSWAVYLGSTRPDGPHLNLYIDLWEDLAVSDIEGFLATRLGLGGMTA